MCKYWDEAFWYLIGAMGDGTTYITSDGHYVIEYGQRDRRWLEVLKSKVEHLGFKAYIVHHKGKYWKLKIYSKEFHNTVSQIRINMQSELSTLPIELFKAYVRGLFDAEGTITKHTSKTARIRIAQKNKALLEIIAKRLRELGIHVTNPFPSDKRGTYVIQIPHTYIRKFIEIVGTEHPSKKSKYEFMLH